ncbi:hypothetical protein BaRGS_00008614, partial [Batillaria attramentaria]
MHGTGVHCFVVGDLQLTPSSSGGWTSAKVDTLFQWWLDICQTELLVGRQLDVISGFMVEVTDAGRSGHVVT